jgi:hypothetical protein
VSSVRYELSFYIPADDNLHSHRCENLKFYIDIEIVFKEILWIVYLSQGKNEWQAFKNKIIDLRVS